MQPPTGVADDAGALDPEQVEDGLEVVGEVGDLPRRSDVAGVAVAAVVVCDGAESPLTELGEGIGSELLEAA